MRPQCRFVLLSLLSVGCLESEGRSVSSTITIGTTFDADESYLSPAWDVSAQQLVLLPLASFNESGELIGRLASRWAHSPDWRRWTIYLRSNVYWHDGVPVTAHDIKWSMDATVRDLTAWLDEAVADSGRADALRRSLAARDYTVTVLDDTTYTVEYHGVGRNPIDWWKVYYPKHLGERMDAGEEPECHPWVCPIGNGPYQYVSHVAQTVIQLEANPQYYGEKPRIERVRMRLGASGIQELLAGNVDAITGLDWLSAQRLAEDPRFELYYMMTTWRAVAIVWNHRHPALREPEVRQALTMAINRRELHAVLNLPNDLPIFDAPPTDRDFQRGKFPEPLPYDPNRSRRLLDAAGWRDADGDGIRERSGRRLAFSMIAAPGDQRAAVYLQDQLRRVGVRVEVQPLSAGIRTRLHGGDFDAAITRLFRDVDQQNYGMFRFMGRDGALDYRNAKAHALLNATSETVDPDSLQALFSGLAAVFRADPPVTYLYPTVLTTVAHRRIRGLSSPFRADIWMYMHELWIEEDGS